METEHDKDVSVFSSKANGYDLENSSASLDSKQANLSPPSPLQMKIGSTQGKGEQMDETAMAESISQFSMGSDPPPATNSNAVSAPFQLKEDSKASNGLPQDVNQKMETALNHDFSNVNIHKESSAATNVGALAYAQGNDVHFAPGQFKPDTTSGQELIGHELTHVVQQSQGRVSATHQENGMNVNNSSALENEADSHGKIAAAGGKVGGTQQLKSSDTTKASAQKKSDVSQKKVIQKAAPLLAGLGAALAAGTASEATAMAGLILSVGQAGASVGGAVAPGTSAVQTANLESGWASNRDKRHLELIIQYRIINKYVERFARQHPDHFNTPAEIEEAKQNNTILLPPVVITPGESAEPEQSSAGDREKATAGLDGTILNAVTSSVHLEIENAYNANQKTLASKKYIWSDSGAHTADSLGTVGTIEFVDVRGSFVSDTLNLSAYAQQVPGLELPNAGQEVGIRVFRGGSMRGESKPGWNDDLSINLIGSGPDKDQAGNSGHGSHKYRTVWGWDGGNTYGDFALMIGSDGTPSFASPVWTNSPDDWSWW